MCDHCEETAPPRTRLQSCVFHFESLLAMYVAGDIPFDRFREETDRIAVYVGTHRHVMYEAAVIDIHNDI